MRRPQPRSPVLGYLSRGLRGAAAYRDAIFEYLDTDEADLRRAQEVQALLAAHSRHRAAKLPDLLIAAVAERHRLVVLHFDSDFDVIAEVTGQPVEWVVPRGTVP